MLKKEVIFFYKKKQTKVGQASGPAGLMFEVPILLEIRSPLVNVS
jgi:hypothetical protein